MSPAGPLVAIVVVEGVLRVLLGGLVAPLRLGVGVEGLAGAFGLVVRGEFDHAVEDLLGRPGIRTWPSSAHTTRISPPGSSTVAERPWSRPSRRPRPRWRRRRSRMRASRRRPVPTAEHDTVAVDAGRTRRSSRFGKAGCVSMAGPSVSTGAVSGSSTHTIAWGLPMDTHVTTTSPGVGGQRSLHDRGVPGSVVGTREGASCGSPMSTVADVHQPVGFPLERDVPQPAERLDGDFADLGRHSLVVHEVLHEAADAVAAHLGGGAVGVVVEHEVVRPRDRRGPDEDQPVGPDTEVAVADPGHRFRGEVELLGEVVDDHEVVAKSVHLGELEFHFAAHSPVPGASAPDSSRALARSTARAVTFR